ncbi:MAG: tetratricopeptide repeat protein [Alphaproteobacteria bacterium]|nr:tetratricopeptide repeat protein [Alphaproteobacteria bacterium]
MRGTRCCRPASAALIAILAPAWLLLASCDEAEEQQSYRATSESPAPEEALDAGETSLAAAYLAGRFAEGARDLKAAADFYLRALELDPDNPTLRKRAFLAVVSDGRFAPSLELAEKIVADDSRYLFAKLVLAVDDINKGDYVTAQTRATGLPRFQLNEIIMPMAVAWTLVGQDKHDEALEALVPLAERRGFKVFHALHTALIKDLQGDAAGAEASYREALGDRRRPPARLVQGLASFYLRQGRKSDAQEVLQHYLQENSSSQLLRAIDRQFKASGKIPALAESARQGYAEALFDVASAFFRENSSRFGLIYGRLALMMAPDFSAGRMLVAEVLERQEHHAEANEMLASIKQDSPFYWPAQVRIASNFNALGETEKSIATLEELSAQRQDDPNPLIDMGDILRSKERFAEAVKAYDRAIERVGDIETRHWTLFYARGIALERAKDWGRAEQDFLKALDLEPDQPYVLNYLGYSWVERGEQLTRAQEMIEKAVAQRPNDGYIVDSLGWVLYRLGDYEGAVRHLEKAVELRPHDAVINDHLGDAYWQVGRRHEARVQWNRALSLKPDEELVPKIQAKIEGGLEPVAETAGTDQEEL